VISGFLLSAALYAAYAMVDSVPLLLDFASSGRGIGDGLVDADGDGGGRRDGARRGRWLGLMEAH